MSAALTAKRFVKKFFQVFGFDVSFQKPVQHVDPMKEGLQRLAQLGLKFNTIVDVGAAIGSWSLMAKTLWPNASFLLVEPLSERARELEAVTRNNPGFYHAPIAAGKDKGHVEFSVSDDLFGSGIANSTSVASSVRKVAVNSIDNEIADRRLQGPYLVKLDTHGFELPIIEGCANILKDVDAFIIECYGFQIANGSLLYWEMCQHMDRLGFRTFDIVDTLRRSSDNAFWQFDIIFIRKGHSVFDYSQYN
jgi:FkbM family methyltransferase